MEPFLERSIYLVNNVLESQIFPLQKFQNIRYRDRLVFEIIRFE